MASIFVSSYAGEKAPRIEWHGDRMSVLWGGSVHVCMSTAEAAGLRDALNEALADLPAEAAQAVQS